MVKKTELDKVLQSTDIKAVQKVKKEALEGLKLEEKRLSNLEAELEEKTGLEAELIAEQIDYLKENSFTEWNKYVYKRCVVKEAELK